MVLCLYYNVEISHGVQGQSTLSGSFILSYEGEYTSRDANNQLESLGTISEVDVKRVDIHPLLGNEGSPTLDMTYLKNNPLRRPEGNFALSYPSEKTRYCCSWRRNVPWWQDWVQRSWAYLLELFVCWMKMLPTRFAPSLVYSWNTGVILARIRNSYLTIPHGRIWT